MIRDESPGVFFIAEAGVNHNGNVDRAHQLVDAAVAARADAVKFQTFSAAQLALPDAPKADYQIESTGSQENQYQMLASLELPQTAYEDLLNHCEESGIEFLSSPFDLQSLRFLSDELGLRTIKVPSGEITNGPLLLEISRRHSRVILSTGASTLDEIREALGVLAYGYLGQSSGPSTDAFKQAYNCDDGRNTLSENVVLLQCTSDYPTALEDANVRAMDCLSEEFGLPVGFSDHTLGTAATLAAVARGAVVVEKHFTLDCALPGPDHQASMEPQALTELIADVRATEKVLGSLGKAPTEAELKIREVVRKSLVADADMPEGHVIGTDDITMKRPGTGISPMSYWDLLGRRLSYKLNTGDFLQDLGDE